MTKKRHLIFLALMLLFLLGHGTAAWVGSEGREWMGWDAQKRDIYVRAYLAGFQKGYAKGCAAGLVTIETKLHAIDSSKYDEGCVSHYPAVSEDSFQYISSITEFYKTYPQQRFLYISDILLGLRAGRTIKQIHAAFPLGDDNKDEK